MDNVTFDLARGVITHLNGKSYRLAFGPDWTFQWRNQG